MLEVATVLANKLGVKIEAEILGDSRAGDIRHCFAAIDLAQDELDFAPAVAFEDGMEELAGWLATQDAKDRVDEATAVLRERGLAS